MKWNKNNITIVHEKKGKNSDERQARRSSELKKQKRGRARKRIQNKIMKRKKANGGK